MLWEDGVEVYDILMKEIFKMRVVLMWTISDFLVYGMFSGWTIYGRLFCLYCQDETGVFWLTNGRKYSWFDCYRRFLDADYFYRKNIQVFRRGKTVLDFSFPWLTGEEIFRERINNIEGLLKFVDCGGNGYDNLFKKIFGYGVIYNWVKKSIFWELSYWENYLFRYSFDFMYIEKNFFDNLTNTVLNVFGKTKDNIKSRLDFLVLCKRRDLEMKEDGTMFILIFRLLNAGKRVFFLWLKNDIKFFDGYFFKFSRCIDESNLKLYGLKSYDCYVIMERLYLFAFVEFFLKYVYTAIRGIYLFVLFYNLL